MRDLDKNYIDEYFDSYPMVDSSTNENYETLDRKGDEDLPPPELKHLPQDIKYRFLDEKNKYLVIVSTNLS
jgi:hypothetical protein